MTQVKAGDKIKLTGSMWVKYHLSTQFCTMINRVYEVYLNDSLGSLCFDDEDGNWWSNRHNFGGNGFEFEIVYEAAPKAIPQFKVGDKVKLTGDELVVCQNEDFDFSAPLVVGEPMQPNDLIELTGDEWKKHHIYDEGSGEVPIMYGRQYHIRLNEDGDFYFINEDGYQWDGLEHHRRTGFGFKVLEQKETQTTSGDTMRPDSEIRSPRNDSKDENVWSEADGYRFVLQELFAKLGEEAPNPDILRAYIEGALSARGYDAEVEVEE